MANEILDPRVAGFASKFKWVLGIAAVLVGGFVAAAYTVSLAAIAVAGVATLVVVHGAPWASQKIGNFFLNLRKADARADPVTNRQRISEETWAKLSERKKQIESLDAEVTVWKNQIESLPVDERAEFADDLQRAQHTVEEQAMAWTQAEEAAKKFDEITKRVDRKWKVAQTGLRIKQLSEKDKAARINEILADEAAESADRQLATAFSSLDAIVARSRTQALSHNPTLTIPVVVDVQAKQRR